MRLGLAVLALAALVACASEAPAEQELSPAACGFPEPKPSAERPIIDAAFLVEGSEVMSTSRSRGLNGGHLFVPLSVDAAFDTYKKLLEQEGYEIVSTDNEGFEAELYFRRESSLGAIQVRSSTCDGATSVFLNIPD